MCTEDGHFGQGSPKAHPGFFTLATVRHVTSHLLITSVNIVAEVTPGHSTSIQRLDVTPGTSDA
ncbi:unnamed protein product [Coffea canephora]|uniref:DH200=94 genomic scaffold, scaffold_855 n=1 Tax=Coffea canephora TaxID=49390 RepID=A0A068VH60_COFCA|nr:unnamed protein product [Coffea canephora]